jgi:hypothetical protein
MTAGPTRTAAEPPARFRDLLATEWLKYRTLRSTPWSLLVTAVAVMAFNIGAAWEHYIHWNMEHITPADFIAQGLPLLDAFGTNAALVTMVAASAIGAVAITSEFSTGLARTTFAAVPARQPVMAAKVSIITAVTTVLGAVTAAASFGLTQAILSGRHAGIPISYPGALQVVVASALLAPLSALIGAAAGAIARHAATAVAGSFAILLILPLIIRDSSRLTAVIAHALPFEAWNRLAAVPYPAGTAYPWTVTGAWAVYLAWALAAAVLAVTAITRRDL